MTEEREIVPTETRAKRQGERRGSAGGHHFPYRGCAIGQVRQFELVTLLRIAIDDGEFQVPIGPPGGVPRVLAANLQQRILRAAGPLAIEPVWAVAAQVIAFVRKSFQQPGVLDLGTGFDGVGAGTEIEPATVLPGSVDMEWRARGLLPKEFPRGTQREREGLTVLS